MTPWNKGLTKENNDIINRCSKKRKGIKFSESHIENLKKARKRIPDRVSGKHWNLSEETRKKMSESKTGEKCCFWKGGISFEKYTIDWTKTLKRSIRERDKYTCQLCGKQQGDELLSVHHIDYKKDNCNPKNLISLCRICHSKTNHDRDRWVKLFNKLYKARELRNKYLSSQIPS